LKTIIANSKEYSIYNQGNNSLEVIVMRPRRRGVSEIAIVENENEVLAINDCMTLLGLEILIDTEDVVVITPNWVQKQKPETGIVVGQESLRAIIKLVKEKGPKRIVVATGSGQKSTDEIMKYCGFQKVIDEEGVEFIDLNQGPYTRINLSHPRVPALNLNKLFNEMTFLISYAQLKLHEEATMSAAIKNIAMGWPSAEEHGYPKKKLGIHDDLHGFITAMTQVIPIDLSIVSASPAMIGTGPAKGIAKHTGLVIAGTDPVAVDTIGARLLGFKPQAVRSLFDCSNKGVGINDTAQMNVKGLSLKQAESIFSTAAYGNAIIMDEK
jgi:uncharacterized protein (DUF362 family)